MEINNNNNNNNNNDIFSWVIYLANIVLIKKEWIVR